MATQTEDIEEYQTTFLTTSDCSVTSLPPLEVLPIGLIHENAALYTTVLESMKQAVPINVKASTVATKKSGLFFAGSKPLAAGEMLFLTHPLVMARSPEEVQAPGPKDPPKPGEGLADSHICDYCFKGPQTFAERGASTKESTSQALPPARRCTGCNLLSFCNKRRDPAFLMHLRVLLMDKADAIAENVMKVIRDLNLPFSLPLQPSLEHNVKNCALHAYHLLALKNRDFTFIRDVLCRILGNQAVITTADETAIVHCFDIALAMLNHSCEPNAFIFVEGRQTRVRSLRAIDPGEEITVALVDTRLDVQNRREALRLQTLNDEYVCYCEMCLEDTRAMEHLVGGDHSQMAVLKQFHANVVPKALQLIHNIKKAVWDKKKTDLIHDFVALAEGEFIAHFGKDPMDSVNYKPIPWLRMAGAAMFLEIWELESALYYATMSFMFHEPCFDPMSVTDLRVLVNTLRAICDLPETDKQHKRIFASEGSKFPTIQDLRAFTVSCTIAFGLLAVKVYGPKLGFVRAVLRWGRDGEAICAPLKPCTLEFNAAAERAQRQIIAWCLGDRTARFYPINPPTRVQYDELTDVLRAREEQLEQADFAEQADQAATAAEYEEVERLAHDTRTARPQQPQQPQQSRQSRRCELSGRSVQSMQTTKSGQSGQSVISIETVCSSQTAQSIQSEQGLTVLRSYEEKMRAAKKAERLLRQEKERQAQQSSRKEDGNTENASMNDQLQVMFDGKMQQMVDHGLDWELDRDKQLGHEFGRAEARSSTVEEVCRLQTDW
ncbi:hypothetical protein SCUCBS95973_000958 [Sporothrix curviconia]|uniref:SET domain-containing protein n=1 Tax=Sporothrix curviconia TaxID=1260050 RepID=A0ABP0AUI1_9PEZI